MADAPEQDLDFTTDQIASGQPRAPEIAGEYDPRPHEDSARRTIAYLLISLLWLLIASMLIFLGFGAMKVSDIKEFSVILGPIVTLVSAATGFYYGTKSNLVSSSK